MKKVTVFILCLAMVSISGSAYAGKETGLYLGGSIGWSALDVSRDQYDFNDSDVGWKIFGGYNFGVIPLLDLAVEGSYVDLGSASSSYVTSYVNGDITGWDLYGLAALNLGPVGIFGKVGQIWWSRDSNISFLDDSGNDMAYGIGVRFQIGSLAIRGEYEYFDLKYTKAGLLSAGVSWTF